MGDVPLHITLLFWITVLISIAWFFKASKSKTFLTLILAWTLIQTILSVLGIYEVIQDFPPAIMLFGIWPALIGIAITFLFRKGRAFIDRIDLKTLTYFHSIRIPVEIVLLLLYYEGLVSVLMTFEGTNFDIFSGLTAPIIAYFSFRNNPVKKKLLLAWNVLCLALLLNVVITAILALPSPFQQFSPEQANTAILHYPFSLLPTVVVPLVLFGHFVALRQLTR